MRPKRKLLGTEVKPLLSINICCKEVMFSNEGRVPVRELLWRAMDLSWERVLISGGSVPETEAELRLIPVTKEPLVSQLTFVHLQKWMSEDQPVGAGDSKERSFDMAAESSEVVRRGRRTKKRWRRRRRGEGVAIAICSCGEGERSSYVMESDRREPT